MSEQRTARIPPLSIEALSKIHKVEVYILTSLQTCYHGKSINVDRASEILSACAVSEMDMKLEYYSSLPDFSPDWGEQIKTSTFLSVAGFLRETTSGTDMQIIHRAVHFALEDHLERRKRINSTRATAPTKQNDRKQIADSYFANFPNATIKILDVCWAVGQHYSEWKRWLRYAVKDDSAPDRAFRAILTSGKPPTEYRKAPRPHGWK
jgi:hypothetical protein